MKNKKTIQTDSYNFKQIVENNNYFVDKTPFIYDLFEDGSYVTVMSRPKRFGKTLNLSMLEHFFDINKKDSAKLFSEFEISDRKEFCEQHQNKYPVINISLKSVKESNWKDCMNSFKKTIIDIYIKHSYLLKSENLDNYDRPRYEKIISGEASEIEYQSSLNDLSRYLQKHFDKNVIILLDDYDTPIINAYQNTLEPINDQKQDKITYYGKVINFLSSFISEAFKGNNSLKKGLITGVMQIAHENIFADCNNVTYNGILSVYFSGNFGFTRQETKKILEHFNLQDDIDSIEKWYSGYKFGDIENICNPWSIVNYIKNKKVGFKSYCLESSEDSLIAEWIKKPNIKKEIQELIESKTITKTIDENFVYTDINDITDLWTILFYNGYLTQIKEAVFCQHELKPPNNEMKLVLKNFMKS